MGALAGIDVYDGRRPEQTMSETTQAIEAILMVADETSRPSCWPSCSRSRRRPSTTPAASWPPPTRPRPGLPAGQGGRRLPVPEPPGPGALRRAVRARGPERPALGSRPGDPRHRRLQAADQPGADGRHPRVNVDGVVRTLEQRGYIEEIARDPGPGQAILYGTTRQFLEKLGLDSVEDLPPLGHFVPGADIVEQLEAGLARAGGRPP